MCDSRSVIGYYDAEKDCNTDRSLQQCSDVKVFSTFCDLTWRDLCECATDNVSQYNSSIVAGVKRASASVCASVCLFDGAKKQIGWNYNHQTCHRNSPTWVFATHLTLGQKVKGQGHRVQKCKNILKAIEWPAWVMHSIECLAFSYLRRPRSLCVGRTFESVCLFVCLSAA